MFFFVCYGADCQKLEFENVYRDSTVYFANAVGNAAGDPKIKDLLQIEFWNSSGEALSKLEVGTTILTDRESCDTCLILYEDNGQKLYSQISGTFNITKVKEGTLESQGNASFRLVEVNDYFTPITGGNCYDVDNMTWDTICIPDCTGKVCGSDGCSSVCGTCGKNEGCSLDQSQCQPLDLSECTGISIDFGTLKKYYSNSFYTSMDGGRPYVYMTFFFPENSTETKIKPGTYDLGNDKNLNYNTCTEAVRLYSGYDSELEDYTKMYFQHGGTITVESVGEKNTIKGTITAKLVEADIAEDNSTTFFAGTKCLEIETAAFDVANPHDPTEPADECFEQKECDTNADCDPGYACDGCWCYIANPDDTDTDSGSESQKECDTNADCDPGYGCEDGKCSECYGENWDCRSDSDCDFGTRCIGCWCEFDNLGDTDTDNSGSNDTADDSSTDTDSGSESQKECKKHIDCDQGYYCENGKCSECYEGLWGCHSDSDCEFGTRCTDGCWCYFDNLDDTDTDNSGSSDTADDSSTDSKSSDGCSALMI